MRSSNFSLPWIRYLYAFVCLKYFNRGKAVISHMWIAPYCKSITEVWKIAKLSEANSFFSYPKADFYCTRFPMRAFSPRAQSTRQIVFFTGWHLKHWLANQAYILLFVCFVYFWSGNNGFKTWSIVTLKFSFEVF